MRCEDFRAPQLIEHQSQCLLLARNVIGSSEQRNKWQGPAGGGKDAVYAGCEIEPTQWSADRSAVRFSAKVFLRFASSFSVFAFSAVQSFGPLNVCCPNASDLFGARFKLLSAGAGSKHGDLCNEQIRDSNERFNLNCGGSRTTQAQGQTRAVAAKKFICGILAGRVQISVLSFFWSFLSSVGWWMVLHN